MKQDYAFKVGDVVQIAQLDRQEGKKDRTSYFKGRVIKLKGSGQQQMVTIRQNIEGIEVDRIYPVMSPIIQGVKLLEKPRRKVRRARLFKISKKI